MIRLFILEADALPLYIFMHTEAYLLSPFLINRGVTGKRTNSQLYAETVSMAGW